MTVTSASPRRRSRAHRRRRRTSGPTPTSLARLRHRRAEARPSGRRRRAAGRHRGGRRDRRGSAPSTACRIVPRGAGTGYTGGAVPTRGGVVISLERMNRILEIDEANLLAVVEPNVITGDLQDAVERVGLFYPPDPGVAAAVGHRRQRRRVRRRTARVQVRHDEALRARPRGRAADRRDRPRPAARSVKNVVGYDLTQLLVGSEGTLAIITRIILRLVPKPPVQATLRATFPYGRAPRRAAVTNIIRRARRAGGARADRRRFARGGRAQPGRAIACAGGTGGAPADRSRRPGRGGRTKKRDRSSRRAATPARPRCCARATRASARSSGASAASCRSR